MGPILTNAVVNIGTTGQQSTAMLLGKTKTLFCKLRPAGVALSVASE